MLVLGIESSCDETGLALVRDGVVVDAILASQADVHALFGGVVPELASREHLRFMGPLYDALMERQGLSAADLDCVAVARGPGLLGCLLVGAAFAKGLCLGSGCRLLGVDHLLAHLLVAGLEQELTFPCIGLLVSGGHTNLYKLDDPVTFVQLGRTLDDAAGEAFDKCAKVLGLPYPGGRTLDALARLGHADPGLFPRPYLHHDNFDFSFSGLKTAVSLYASSAGLTPAAGTAPFKSPEEASPLLCDCCASFNLAVVETLLARTARALDACPECRSLIVAGGVAANTLLRERMKELMAERGVSLHMPAPARCTDNAVMIAYTGWLWASHGLYHDLSLEPVPRGRPVPRDACHAASCNSS